MDLPTDHSRHQLMVIDSRYTIPSWVKSAEILDDAEKAAALQSSQFADPMLRQLPITSPADTWVSAAYFNENRHTYDEHQAAYIEGNLRKAAAVFQVEDEVAQVFATSMPKQANAEDDDANYCQLTKSAAGETISRGFPVFNGEDLKNACEYMVTWRDRFKFAEAHEIAKNIVRRSNEMFGDVSPVSDRILKLAGAGVVELHQIVEELDHLANQCPDSKVAMDVKELILGMVDDPTYADSTETQVKLAQAVEDLQTLLGFNYDNHQFPEEIVWGMSIKEAQALADDAITLGKLTYSLTKLSELDPGAFAVLGDDFVLDITSTDGGVNREKLADILPTIPLPDKRILETHLQSTFS